MTHADAMSSANDRFMRCGVDRILLRSAESSIRRSELVEGLRLRRLSGVTPERIERARRHFAASISAQPPPLRASDFIDEFVRDLLNERARCDLRFGFLDCTVMRPGERRSGSFKDYVTFAFLDRIAAGEIPREVQSVSTGNHAFAVTNAVRCVNQDRGLSIRVTATMDIGASEAKKKKIRDAGGTVREFRPLFNGKSGFVWRLLNAAHSWLMRTGLIRGTPIRTYKEAEDIVNAEAESDPRCMRIPHDDDATACGYSVMALEILEAMRTLGFTPDDRLEADWTVLCPLGSGGLLRGMLEFAAFPSVRTYGVSAPPARMMFDSLRTGDVLRLDLPADPTFRSDGIVATTEPTAYRAAKELADGALLVRDEDAFMATALLFAAGMEVEPTSGLPLAAAILHGDLIAPSRWVLSPLTGRYMSDAVRNSLRDASRDCDAVARYFRRRLEETASC